MTVLESLLIAPASPLIYGSLDLRWFSASAMHTLESVLLTFLWQLFSIRKWFFLYSCEVSPCAHTGWCLSKGSRDPPADFITPSLLTSPLLIFCPINSWPPQTLITVPSLHWGQWAMCKISISLLHSWNFLWEESGQNPSAHLICGLVIRGHSSALFIF